MFDREMAQAALNSISPEYQAMVHEAARTRGVAACDIALETALQVAQEEAGKALFALRKEQSRPRLRLI
ncbi:hypothetical protein MHM84_01105 [Halomonas sp. McH1-25]|uniref:hypothetical protein n=1 Tax=unclassified Halomonas TaxID=2609666 RepID=UPI001EF703D1|nr:MULTISPECIES: hypothetical protein [unclassified Halomonas]MCG7598379.1 hypothetical protein [Halomonas sp. McH1-25]MCP1342679.1 hypothetical protein [Halomonas sp. FL8]MCP1362553.1 hypothetical protein [Halomonas sp. BBD45]MCP1363719.1 hypothetical protein [Halomonas sp. BBD48]